VYKTGKQRYWTGICGGGQYPQGCITSQEEEKEKDLQVSVATILEQMYVMVDI
jgi:hypothetical protein